MSYTPFNWLPRLGQGLNKFTDQITGQVLQLNSTPDSVTQQGTPFSATRMNALEQGLGNVYDKSEQMESTIPSLFGLGSGTVPSDILDLLSSAVLINAGKTALTDVKGNEILSIPGVQIQKITYSGSGTYGSSNPNTLTFSINPIIVLIFPHQSVSYVSPPSIYLWGATSMAVNSPYLDTGDTYATVNGLFGACECSTSGKKMTWFTNVNTSGNGDTIQLNQTGWTYDAVSIGLEDF